MEAGPGVVLKLRAWLNSPRHSARATSGRGRTILAREGSHSRIVLTSISDELLRHSAIFDVSTPSPALAHCTRAYCH